MSVWLRPPGAKGIVLFAFRVPASLSHHYRVIHWKKTAFVMAKHPLEFILGENTLDMTHAGEIGDFKQVPHLFSGPRAPWPNLPASFLTWLMQYSGV